mmetsp:Transcript_5581/g.10798  ORF Transcript_5581/g.10798 Transcript_5581/m.10798 type:complete len:311 (+) Transcript_5581:1131-2063(+)
MSPAPIAPASATAPATRLATMFPGETMAKRIWDTFPMPDTGLRSVSPRARTARTATRMEKRTAMAGSRGGMSNMGERMAVQRRDARRRPGSHVCHVICCSGGAGSSSSSTRWLPSFDDLIVWSRTFADSNDSDTAESASMIAKDTHSNQPRAPVPTSLIGPVAHPSALAMGANMPQPTMVPNSMDTAVLGPMMRPCPKYEGLGCRVHDQAVSAGTPRYVPKGMFLKIGTKFPKSVYTAENAKHRKSRRQAGAGDVEDETGETSIGRNVESSTSSIDDTSCVISLSIFSISSSSSSSSSFLLLLRSSFGRR